MIHIILLVLDTAWKCERQSTSSACIVCAITLPVVATDSEPRHFCWPRHCILPTPSAPSIKTHLPFQQKNVLSALPTIFKNDPHFFLYLQFFYIIFQNSETFAAMCGEVAMYLNATASGFKMLVRILR